MSPGLCPEPAGLDEEDAYAEGGDFGREGFCEGVDGGFGGSVVACVRGGVITVLGSR